MTDVDGFELFWQVYPRKVGKAKAREIWIRKRDARPEIGEILEAVRRARATEQWCRDGGQFVPHPSTWLYQERWADVLEVEVDEARPADFLARLRGALENRGNVVELRHARK